MTAEERIAEARSFDCHCFDCRMWREVGSLLDALRAANAEQRAVIERLTRPESKVAIEPRGLGRRVHELKTWPQFFEAVASGAKSFEARLNDRGYRVGDRLLLQEWDRQTKTYTGRELVRDVTYVLSGYEGLVSGFVVMGIVAPPEPSTAAIRHPRLCSRTACAGDVADFVRDADEMGGQR